MNFHNNNIELLFEAIEEERLGNKRSLDLDSLKTYNQSRESYHKEKLQFLLSNEHIQKYLNQKDVFIRFSDLPYWKINKKYAWGTIAGYYGFPMHREVLISALTSQWSYKKYILIFKVNGKILRASEYTIAQLKKDLTIILSNCEKRYGVSLSEHDMKVIKTQLKDVSSLGFKYNKYSRVTSQYNHPIAFQGFMKIVSYLSQLIDHNESFTQLELIKECGYDAIYDDTGHRLTHDIAAQIAVLEEKAIQPLVKFENPNNLENMLRRQEERDRRTN